MKEKKTATNFKRDQWLRTAS